VIGKARLGPAICFGVVLTLAAFALDPAVPDAYLPPKEYALLLASAFVLLWAVRTPKWSSDGLRLTALEVTLAASILWGFIANPRWLATRDGRWFWLSVSALLLTIVVRQCFNLATRETVTHSEPTPRTAALADLMTSLWIVGSVLAVHGLAQAFAAGSFHFVDGSVKTAVISTIGTPNSFGAFMAAGIVAALASAAQAKSRPVRWLLVGAALLQLGALFGNGSRAALLGLFSAGLLVLWLRMILGSSDPAVAGAQVITGIRRRRRGAVVAGPVLLVAIAFAGFLLHRLNPSSGRGRLIAWEVSGAMLADRPLTGVGTGRFPLEWGRYETELWRYPEYAEFDRQATQRPAPNSELFRLLAERGLPGGALYVMLWAFALGFLLRALRRGEGTSALDWGLLALLVATLVHSLLDDNLHWVPTLVTAHLAFGLIPAPVLMRAHLGRWRAAQLAVAGVWAATVAVKTVWEYPGYQLWEKGRGKSGAESLGLLERAQRRLRSDPWLDNELGLRLLEAGRPEQAAMVLERGLEAEGDDYNSRLALAEAHLALGWLQPAELHVRTVAAHYPDRVGPRLLLARIHHAKGEDAQARAALTSCIRRDTYFRSALVDSVATQATRLWRIWYDDEPPR
jgi:O-antigen ligase